MNPFEPLQLATMLLCVIQVGRAFAAERHVPSQYSTIQQAVNAAVPGDTVRIAAGNYTEQVLVAFKTGLTLAGEPDTVLHAFPGMQPLLADYGWPYLAVCAIYRSDVVVSGLHFEGESLGSSTVLEGVSFAGARGMVTNCTFSGFRAAGTSNSSAGWGLFCANLVGTGAGRTSITIADNTFTNNQIAIRLGGDPLSNPEHLRLTAKVHRNIIKGFGPAPGSNSGIWLICGVTGEVRDNFFADFAGTGGVFSAAFVAYDSFAPTHGRFVPLRPLNFEDNTFTNNGIHLSFMGGNDSRVVNNSFLGLVPSVTNSWGGLQVSGTNVLVANNNFSDLPIGTLLHGTGNESWSGWPSFPPAVNPTLVANWFCSVAEPIRFNPLVTALQEQGTETNCLSAPRFQSITKSSNGEILTSLRGWHGDSYVIETSTNLQNWFPVHTNLMTLPVFESGTPIRQPVRSASIVLSSSERTDCPFCPSDFA